MKKTTITSLIISGFLGVASAQAATINATTWFTESNLNANVSSAGSNVNTLQLENTDLNTARIAAVTQLDQAVTFTDVGDFIQFSGDYSGSIGNNVGYSIRIGFYDSTGLTIDTDFDADMDSLKGFWAGLGTRTTSGARSGVFSQNDALPMMRLNDGSPSAGLLGATVQDISTGNRSITYRIERIAGDLLQFTFTDGVNVNLTRTLAVASAPSLSVNSFSGGFNLGTGSTARFENISITAIPEPSTFALLGIALGSLVLLRRRK